MFKTFASFILGGVVGAVAAAYYFKQVYADMAEEEIAAVKKKYCYERKDGPEEEKEERPVEKKPEEKVKRYRNLHEYREILRKEGYTNYRNAGDLEEDDMDRPFTISPDAFGEKYGSDNCISLTYYEDGVLEDEMGDIVSEVDIKIGRENLDTFGEYEEDTVYVRNDMLKTDYEIQRVNERYSNPNTDD